MAQNNYTRQSNFSNGDVIDATLFNAEYDQLELAFAATGGHRHDGSAGGGTLIPLIGSEDGKNYATLDVSEIGNPKFTVVIDEVTTFTVDKNTGIVSDYFDTQYLTHNAGNLQVFLDDLDSRVIDASAAAAQAVQSASEAQQSAIDAAQAAMIVGVPSFVIDGGTYTIDDNDAVVDVIFEGDGTLELPVNLLKGRRFIARVSFKAVSNKLLTIANPNFSIIGDKKTLVAGENLTLSPGQLVVLEAISTTELEIV